MPSASVVGKPRAGARIDWTHPLARGLLHYWPLNEAAGSRCADLAGGRAGVFEGAMAWAAGGVRVDGGGSGARADTSGPLSGLTSGFTIAARARTTATAPGVTQRVFASARTSSANGLGVGIINNFPVLTTFGVADMFNASLGIVAGRSYSFVWTLSSSFLFAPYVDGGAWPTTAGGAGATANTDDAWYLGASTAVGSSSIQEAWNGDIDYIAVWNRVLTPVEITQLHAQPYALLAAPSWRRYLAAAAPPAPPPPPASRTATYAVLVDWSTGTDADTSAFNDVTADVLGAPGLSIEIGRDQARAFAPPVVPHAGWELLNEDRLYSPGGELGQYVGRGPDATITSVIGGADDVGVDSPTINVNDTATLVGGAATVTLFSGHLDTAEHDLDYGHRVVALSALGQLTLLRNAAAITTALYENITTGAALTVILDAAGWPADKRSISTGQTAMRYWWLSNVNAFDAMLQLLQTEGANAAVYEDGTGTIHFEDRAYRSTAARSTTPQYVLWDTAGGAAINVDDASTNIDSSTVYVDSGNPNALFYGDGAKLAANPDEVVTEATATVVARSDGTLGRIWQSGTAFTLAPSEVRDYYITSSDPFKSAVTPVISTDYTITAGSLASVTLSQTSGQTARLRLTASGSGASVSGPTGDETNGIQVRAVPVTTRYTTVVRSTVDTSAAQARYTGGQVKTRDLGLWPSVSIDTAQSMANDFVTQYQAPRQQWTMTLINADAAHLQAMHSIGVSDRLTVVNAQAVETLDVHVETLRHQVTTGGLHALTLGCEVISSIAGVVDPGPGGGGGGGLPAQFGTVSPYAQFGTTHSFTS